MACDLPIDPSDPAAPGAPDPGPPLERPSLRSIAEAVHDAGSRDAVPHLIRVCNLPDCEELELGFHALSADLPRTFDCLVGFRAPNWWDAVGVTTFGRLHHQGDDQPAESARFTTIVSRHDGCVSVIEGDRSERVVIEDPPTGWSHDVLLRVLGLDTAPPEGSPALVMDLWWLDAVASLALAKPRSLRSWGPLARAHPLCPPGTIPSPNELAALTASEALARPWWFLRQRFAKLALPAEEHGPKGEGETLPAGRWFDDGSLCRWMLRDLPPADLLLADLLATLPAHLADSLLAGLVEAELPAAA